MQILITDTGHYPVPRAERKELLRKKLEETFGGVAGLTIDFDSISPTGQFVYADYSGEGIVELMIAFDHTAYTFADVAAIPMIRLAPPGGVACHE